MKLLSIIFLIIFLSGSSLFAEIVTLSWTAPTTCEDNSPIGETCQLSGYKIYYYSTGNYMHIIDVGNVLTMQISLSGGTYYFKATAYDTPDSTESGYSNEVTKTILGGGSDNCAGFQTGIGAEHKYGEGAKHKWQ